MERAYDKTLISCFVAYIVQAIVNNFGPLLFLTFQSSYDLPLSEITLLVTFNFGIQLMVDMLSVLFVDRIGYRTSMILAHTFSTVGIVGLTVLPEILPSPFMGLLISVMIYAIGGGLLEVIVSPIVEACPTDNKEKAMSLLHSFYCWGHVGVVLISTIFFSVFGTENWRVMALIWALLPLLNAFAFMKVPIAPLIKEGEKDYSLRELLSIKLFWIFFIMMISSGASEQAVSQWASTFAEEALGVSKTIGDLMGPMSFALLMGSSRLLYGTYGERIKLDNFMIYSAILCIASYLIIALSPFQWLSLAGCALSGLSVGIMWPGTFSKASHSLPGGGTALFSLLALGGDIGCSSGPTLVGLVSSAFSDDFRIGILFGIIFPLMLLCGILILKKWQATPRGGLQS